MCGWIVSYTQELSAKHDDTSSSNVTRLRDQQLLYIDISRDVWGLYTLSAVARGMCDPNTSEISMYNSYESRSIQSTKVKPI